MGRFIIVTALFCWSVHAQLVQQPIRVNLGGPAVIDKYGLAWSADTCTGDSVRTIEGNYPRPVYNTAGFNTKESIPFLCNFTVFPGIYGVTFYLNEPFVVNNGPLRRVFDILLNGQPLIEGVDIFARAGAVRTGNMLTVPVQTTGPLNFSFVSRTNPAMVAGIEIVPLFEFGGIVDEEIPTGLLDGTNNIFTLANPPAPPSSLRLYINGLRMRTGIDFSLSGNTITLTGFIPGPGQNILASYRCSPCSAPSASPVAFLPTAISSEFQLSRADLATNVPMSQAVIMQPQVFDYTGTLIGCRFLLFNDETRVNQPAMTCLSAVPPPPIQ